ncbi:MAG: glutamate--tRNA ligase [Syntrophobacteraceae bacterium]|nr:glutamate--tRNA ligase [Syntrophobacteraceae bacterium]
MEPVITRFPPSPTGALHIGGARTALFNWLFARSLGGRFILRIEDTDVERSTQESVTAILDAMQWLDLNFDEGPYYQTSRLDIYRDYARKLKDSGHAYWCECSAEELEVRRNKAMAEGRKPKYDGACRSKGLCEGPNRVLRFYTPQSATTVLNDLIKGPIEFDNSELDDLVILKSDGFPTYNFAVVVDDITMGITHVIRGDDHVNNTPRQILIYRALGAKLPEFAHVPMIHGEDRSPLSKRHGATSVMEYEKMGFLPEALINCLVRLGWSHGDQEIFSRSELIEKFTLENVGKSPSIFTMERLLWLNAHYIKEKSPQELLAHLKPFLARRSYPEKSDDFLTGAIRTLQTRTHTLEEMAEAMAFYMEDAIRFEPEAATKFLTKDMGAVFLRLISELSELEAFDEASLEPVFRNTAKELEVKLGKIAQPVRVALTGGTKSPGLFEIMEVLGKEAVVERLQKGLEFILAA